MGAFKGQRQASGRIVKDTREPNQIRRNAENKANQNNCNCTKPLLITNECMRPSFSDGEEKEGKARRKERGRKARREERQESVKVKKE